MICDVCDFESESETAVCLCRDGVIRCKRCRHILKYGRLLYSFRDYEEHRDDPPSPYDPAEYPVKEDYEEIYF